MNFVRTNWLISMTTKLSMWLPEEWSCLGCVFQFSYNLYNNNNNKFSVFGNWYSTRRLRKYIYIHTFIIIICIFYNNSHTYYIFLFIYLYIFLLILLTLCLYLFIFNIKQQKQHKNSKELQDIQKAERLKANKNISTILLVLFCWTFFLP